MLGANSSPTSKIELPIERISIRLPRSDRYIKLSKRLSGLGSRGRSSWLRKALLLMLEEEELPLRQQMRDAIAEYRKTQLELLELVKQLKASGVQPGEPVAQVKGRKVNISKLSKMVNGT